MTRSVAASADSLGGDAEFDQQLAREREQAANGIGRPLWKQLGRNLNAVRPRRPVRG